MNDGFQERRKRGGVSSASIALLLALLFFPALAFLRLAQTFDPRLLLSYVTLISAITYFLYGHDKKKAQVGEWRTPESTLHLVELLGGWPGAFLAQRAFRHKISKTSYQVTFWTIIVLHEFASFDFTQNWACLKKGIVFFQQ